MRVLHRTADNGNRFCIKVATFATVLAFTCLLPGIACAVDEVQDAKDAASKAYLSFALKSTDSEALSDDVHALAAAVDMLAHHPSSSHSPPPFHSPSHSHTPSGSESQPPLPILPPKSDPVTDDLILGLTISLGVVGGVLVLWLVGYLLYRKLWTLKPYSGEDVYNKDDAGGIDIHSPDKEADKLVVPHNKLQSSTYTPGNVKEACIDEPWTAISLPSITTASSLEWPAPTPSLPGPKPPRMTNPDSHETNRAIIREFKNLHMHDTAKTSTTSSRSRRNVPGSETIRALIANHSPSAPLSTITMQETDPRTAPKEADRRRTADVHQRSLSMNAAHMRGSVSMHGGMGVGATDDIGHSLRTRSASARFETNADDETTVPSRLQSMSGEVPVVAPVSAVATPTLSRRSSREGPLFMAAAKVAARVSEQGMITGGGGGGGGEVEGTKGDDGAEELRVGEGEDVREAVQVDERVGKLAMLTKTKSLRATLRTDKAALQSWMRKHQAATLADSGSHHVSVDIPEEATSDDLPLGLKDMAPKPHAATAAVLTRVMDLMQQTPPASKPDIATRVCDILDAHDSSTHNACIDDVLAAASDSETNPPLLENPLLYVVVALMDSPYPAVQLKAAKASAVLMGHEGVAVFLAEAGAMSPLVSLLGSMTAHMQVAAANALKEMSAHSAVHEQMFAAGAVQPIIDLMSSPSPTMSELAVTSFLNIAANPNMLMRLSAYVDPAQLIYRLLRSGNAGMQIEALFLVYSLALSGEYVPDDSVIKEVVKLLGTGVLDVQEAAAVATEQLSVNVQFAEMLVSSGVVPQLLAILQGDRANVQVMAAGALVSVGRDAGLRAEVLQNEGVVARLKELAREASAEDVRAKAEEALLVYDPPRVHASAVLQQQQQHRSTQAQTSEGVGTSGGDGRAGVRGEFQPRALQQFESKKSALSNQSSGVVDDIEGGVRTGAKKPICSCAVM